MEKHLAQTKKHLPALATCAPARRCMILKALVWAWILLVTNVSCPVEAQTSSYEDRFVDLTSAPELPELPAYPEHKFIQGIEFPYMPGGAAFILRFATQQKSDRVLQWYTSALPVYGWTVKSASAHAVSAKSKGGNYCTIRIVSPMPGEKYAYALNYRMKKR